jgi:hypothetical protein
LTLYLKLTILKQIIHNWKRSGCDKQKTKRKDISMLNLTDLQTALRSHLRVSTTRGSLSVEDLYDLPLTELNDTLKQLNRKLKTIDEEDFLNDDKESKEDKATKLAFKITKHILDAKKEERDIAKNSKLVAEQKQKILDLIDKKDQESLQNLSREDLLKKLEELN